MDEFWREFGRWWADDGLRLLGDVVIPVAAILIPTVIAIRLARSERHNATHDRKIERRLQAGAEVITALAPLASIRADQPIQEHLWKLRSAIAVYRAWLDRSDPSGDWLALRHREGMTLWSQAMSRINRLARPDAVTPEGMVELLEEQWAWAAHTTEMFTGYLSGHVPEKDLLADGARILKAHPKPEDASESGDS